MSVIKKNGFGCVCLLFILLSSSGFAQKIIENPAFEVSKSGITHISKIELSATETKIHVHNTFLRYWWVDFSKDIFIQDCATGEKYQVTGIEGGEFEEHIFMPESGEKTITLTFPPLSKTIKKIDYNNRIYGISLGAKQAKKKKQNTVPKEVTNWINLELSKSTEKPITDYNSPQFFSKTPARLIGYIKGYDKRLDFTTGIMYMGNVITREDYPIVIPIEPDGRFEVDLPILHPLHSYISINNKTIALYFEPGQTLAMILDWEEFLTADRLRNIRYKFKDIVFKGAIAKVNEDLLGFTFKIFNYKVFEKQVTTLSPVDFNAQQLETRKENAENIKKYIKEYNISTKAKKILDYSNRLEYATQLFNFVSDRSYAVKKDTLNDILKIPVTDDFYNFLKDIPLNDKGLLVVDRFSEFVNRFEFSKAISIYYPKAEIIKHDLKPEKTLLEYFEEMGIELLEKDKALRLSFEENPPKSVKELMERYKLYSDEYKKAEKAYSKKYIQPLINKNSEPQKISMEKWSMRDSVVTNTFKLEKNLVCDMMKIRALKYDISRSNSTFAHEYWNTLKKDIADPFLQQEGARMVNKAFPIITKQDNVLDGQMSKKTTITVKTIKLPEGRATTIFKNIMDAYKGKIIFVDFWATSCAPCVGGIKRMKETRAEYEGNKDFDFVFITDERQSPKNKYSTFIKEQELKNTYRIPTDDYNYLRQLFKFNGIPKYVVIDKKGDVLNDSFEMYNFKSELAGILAENK